ncbi:hypothetical protein D9M69_657030 [compost metagenome]
MVSPTFFMSALSCAEGTCTVMPFFLSRSRYSTFFFFEVSQPRFSASAAALSSACCTGLSSASKAFLFMSTAFLGSQAWVS